MEANLAGLLSFLPEPRGNRKHNYSPQPLPVLTNESFLALSDRNPNLADTAQSKALVNERMTYVAVSRAASEVRIYTDSAAEVSEKLARRIRRQWRWNTDWIWELLSEKPTGPAAGASRGHRMCRERKNDPQGRPRPNRRI